MPRSAGVRELDLVAIASALLCAGAAWLSHAALNPDGVSYLDLATALQHGAWSHFVQGYWSPLLPFVVGATGAITGVEGPALVTIAHALNGIAAVGAVIICWHWGRRRAESRSAAFGLTALAALLLCSAGIPRIEAVTPDVILLFVTTWLAYELLEHAGRRWWLVGLLLGASYLAKTSSWPWLLVIIPIRWWAAGDREARRRVWQSTAACAIVMLAWVVPMSLKYAMPTLGSSGRLNWSWYIEANTSRMPDTDGGTNSDYHAIDVGNGRSLLIAAFDDPGHWTYQPWGDPTDWSTHVLTETGRGVRPVELFTYWLRMFARTFGLWLAPLLLAVVAPWIVLRRRAGMWRELVTTRRDALAVIVAGTIGVLQFVAIHAEPRLIAPFGMLLAIGAIDWLFGAERDTPPLRSRALRVLLASVGWLAIAGFTVPRTIEGVSAAERLRGVTAQLDELRRRVEMMQDGPLPIGIVGPAAGVMASAYWINARIAYQIPPRYANLIATLSDSEQQAMLLSVFRGRVPLVWRTSDDGSMQMLLVPPN